MFLLFARHGETADNKNRVFQGQRFPGPSLNETGRAQAQRLARRVSRMRPGPNALVSSDLARAVETAEIVAAAVGLPVALDPALREVDVGTWTGKTYDEVRDLYPEEYASWDAGLDVHRGGGETYAELGIRIENAVRRISGERVLVVSHGGAIKSFVARILGVSSGGEGLAALAGVANAGLTVVERDHRSGRYRLHAWNDTAHLEGLAVDEHSD